MKFERTDEMVQNMTIDAFGGDVELDLYVDVRYVGSKLKAYSPKLGCYLQFPRKLRKNGATFICDAREVNNGGRTFYSAYKGTIRNSKGTVIA